MYLIIIFSLPLSLSLLYLSTFISCLYSDGRERGIYVREDNKKKNKNIVAIVVVVVVVFLVVIFVFVVVVVVVIDIFVQVVVIVVVVIVFVVVLVVVFFSIYLGFIINVKQHLSPLLIVWRSTLLFSFSSSSSIYLPTHIYFYFVFHTL